MRDGKEVFLNGEGDSYFIRNKEVMENRTGGGVYTVFYRKRFPLFSKYMRKR